MRLPSENLLALEPWGWESFLDRSAQRFLPMAQLGRCIAAKGRAEQDARADGTGR